LFGNSLGRFSEGLSGISEDLAANGNDIIVGGLLLTNADFRLFVDDIVTVGRQIFADTAESLAGAEAVICYAQGLANDHQFCNLHVPRPGNWGSCRSSLIPLSPSLNLPSELPNKQNRPRKKNRL
jgi:hypothetical protein